MTYSLNYISKIKRKGQYLRAQLLIAQNKYYLDHIDAQGPVFRRDLHEARQYYDRFMIANFLVDSDLNCD